MPDAATLTTTELGINCATVSHGWHSVMSQSRSIKGGTTDDGVSATAFFFLLVKTLTFLARSFTWTLTCIKHCLLNTECINRSLLKYQLNCFSSFAVVSVFNKYRMYAIFICVPVLAPQVYSFLLPQLQGDVCSPFYNQDQRNNHIDNSAFVMTGDR